MEIRLSKYNPQNDLTILPIFSEERAGRLVKQKTNAALPQIAESDFKNELGKTQLVYPEGIKRLLLVGLGKRRQFSAENWRIAIHSAITSAQALGAQSVSLFTPNLPAASTPKYLELAGFGIVFSSYQFNQYQKEKKDKLALVEIAAAINKRNEKALNQGVLIGRAADSARDLANHPGNVATPTHLAKHAAESARKYKFRCRVLGPKEIAKEKMGLIMGVSQGTDQPPKFIILEYGDSKKPPIILIGKGLTFDSGGVSIKPADRMEEMKYDMCGGATVIGIFEAVASLKLPVRIVGLIPSTENLLSGRAVKPGDILLAHDKTSVEIINTDAEGRLVLADAISYAQTHYKPKLMIDYATLTGAVLIALGDTYTGYFANTKNYDRAIKQAADATAEKLWSLPLAQEYKEQLKSSVADIKNIGEKGSAGATTAGLFLEHFVKNVPWIHLDIAGTAWTMRPKNYVTPGATAWGVYFTVEFLRNI